MFFLREQSVLWKRLIYIFLEMLDLKYISQHDLKKLEQFVQLVALIT